MLDIVKWGSLLMLLGLGACTKSMDLDAPCPDFGRYCRQTAINAWDNDEVVQSQGVSL